MNKLKKKMLSRKYFIGMLIFFLIFILFYISIVLINNHVKASVKDKIITEDNAKYIEVDCILILGAGVWSNGRPSYMLEDRLLKGIELYKNGSSKRLLMSGDHGRKDYDEVNTMKQYAVKKGVFSGHIFMDHAGFSTYDSLYRARDIFCANKIIIVTQRYHLYRALYIAEKLGLEAYGIPSNLRNYYGQGSMEFREKLARIKDFLYVIVKPEPRYLGDTIPVSGDGNITND